MSYGDDNDDDDYDDEEGVLNITKISVINPIGALRDFARARNQVI